MVGSRLLRAGFRHQRRHSWQTLLAILGIMLGVAIVMAVGLANQSASRAFEITMEQISGQVTHQIVAGPDGIPESLYTSLRLTLPTIKSAPVVEGLVRVRKEQFTLLGLDPLSEQPFRNLTLSPAPDLLNRLLTQPDGVLISAYTARRLDLAIDKPLTLEIAGKQTDTTIIAQYGAEQGAALDGVLVADIAVAQTLLQTFGQLTRIDLILTEQEVHQLQQWLPKGMRLIETRQRTATMADMSKAFQTNLTAMSLLALLVGGFLIYNTATFSVLQRRRQFGIMRLIGATRGEVFRLILFEQMLIGLIGTLLGMGAGILLARELLWLVTRTINDLYYTLTVTRLDLAPGILITGMLLGLITTLLASAPPAWEATRSRPQSVNRRSVIERQSHRAIPWLFVTGLIMLAAGLWLATHSDRNLLLGFTALFCFIVGYCLLVPAFVPLLSRLLNHPIKRLFGTIGRLATRGIEATLSRTGPAIAALTLAIAATIGMGIMVDSFRATVGQWLNQTLQGDIYISATDSRSKQASAPLPEHLPETLLKLQGVREISTGRHVTVESDSGPINLLAIGLSSTSYQGFNFKGETLPALWQQFATGNLVLVSEPYAYHNQLQVGDPLTLLTPKGDQTFKVGGIFFDYGSDRGLVVLPRTFYAERWQDSQVTTLGVYLKPDAALDQLLSEIKSITAQSEQPLTVRANQEILSHSLEIFDRTFTITRVLRLLVIAVAFVGILSAMLALQLERAKEHAILRATGLTPGQLFGQITLQTLLMGVMAALLAIPLGWLMAEILIHVINLSAFGWSMPSQLSPAVLLEAVLFALIASLLAGLYPSLRMGRTRPALALREE
ncbi:MAG: ABC transporter permease [Sedimenticola sp.]|nr:ABC transporter permease [Sedimenticola sp.]